MQVTPVAGALGAEISGVDLRDPGFDFAGVYQALLDHEVIFFREANLTEAEHLALGERFGTPSIFPVARLMGATEPTMTVIADGPHSANAADAWHTDVTWTATPPKCALLHMELAPERGGDTLWCSATAAFDALSEPMQQFLSGLTAVHDNEGFIEGVMKKAGDAAESLAEGLRRDYPPVQHPLIRTHPETGKKAILYAGRFLKHIEGLTDAESTSVLQLIDDHVKEPRFHCRWRWTNGDLAIWDERSTLHRAAADHFPQERIIRRLEIDGDRPY
ncbi:MAG: taurine dioxygenase [Acidimicrobiales bacterium]|nr:taurine dioxygenase [Acidimicrobiales bacterium]